MPIEIHFFEEVNLEGKHLITGFHGIGVVGYIATKFLIEETGAKKIGMITSEKMPPLVSLDEEGTIQLPFELFLDDENDFVYLLVRFSPHPSELRDFTVKVAELIEDSGMHGLILLGGLDESYKPEDDEDGYRAVITNGFNIEGLGLEKPPLIDAGLFISGGIAMLLIELQKRHVPSITLFPFADRENPDMIAASKAITIINQLFDIQIKTENLMEEAKEFEEEVDQILQQEKKKESNHIYM